MNLDLTDYLLVTSFAGTVSALAWINRRKTASASLPSPSGSVHKPSRKACPAGYLPTLSADELFEKISGQHFLTQIYQSLGYAPENYAVDVEPLLGRVAEFIQLLPASESHHHANPGGLLVHLLEVANIALKLCEEAKLPIGRPTEEQLRHAARWRYGVLVGALLHDIGKPIADVIVHVMDERGAVKEWNGLGGLITDFGIHYKVSFPLQKDYKAHQRLPVMLLKSLVPQSTMKWLSEDPELIPLLIAYLSGEYQGGIIGNLVKTADGKSVSRNLLNGDRTRFATARQVPMIERLMHGLRRMLAEGGHIALNREGAAGFSDGKDIWFVAGVIADKARDYLNKSEQREQGAAALPTDNSRLFDVWLDYGVIHSNNGSAIWKGLVTINKGSGSAWVQAFTMIRFPLHALYSDPSMYPPALNGTIEVVPEITPAMSAQSAPAQSAPSSPPIAEAPAEPETPTPISQGFALTPSPPDLPAEPAPIQNASSSSSDIDEDWTPSFLSGRNAPPTSGTQPSPPAASVPSSAPTDQDEFLDEEDMAISIVQVQPATTKKADPAVPTAPVIPAQVKPPKKSVLGEIPGPAPEVEEFIAWIQKGVAQGQMTYNRADATLHFVAEGLLLITPKIFRDFFQAVAADDPQDAESLGPKVRRLQRLLQGSKYVSKANPKSYLHFYRIKSAKNPARAQVTGYLIADPSLFFSPIPSANPTLERITGALPATSTE